MATSTIIDSTVLVEELGSELRALKDRVAQLEASLVALHQTTAAGPIRAPESQPENVATLAPAQAPAPEPISEEILVVIAAACAALLGERLQIRQIRLTGSPAWRQQGRVSIQASHHLQH